MIQKISFQNYKAFEIGEIKLKPITILLGANSVGKSSIINLLLMLQQTANSINYKSALRLHGENVSMGECENIFRNKETDKNIVIDFEVENEKLKGYFSEYLPDFLSEQIIGTYSYLKGREQQNSRIINKIISTKKKIKSKEQLLEYVSDIEEFRKKIEKKSSHSKEDKFILNLCKVINGKNSIAVLYDFITKVTEIRNNIFKLSFEICNVKSNTENVLKICRISLSNEGKQIINIKFDFNDNNTCYNNITVSSDFIENTELIDNTTKEEFKQSFNYDSTIFSSISQSLDRWDRSPIRYGFLFKFSIFDFEDENNNKSKHSIATQIFLQIINLSVESVKNQFKRELVNHVTPLRATPKRYYFLDKANINTILDTFDGNSLTEILKDDENVKSKVNKWLETFGLEVNVDTLQDVIHKLKIHQYSLDLDIIDVGFGISQILPVIVQGFLSYENSLTMIEQPETHLHPKMQADLADLFIDIIEGTPHTKILRKPTSNPRKYLLIETHSEYLLRRLRRRISEGKLLAKDVAVYFIEPPKNKNSSAEIKEKEVNDAGFFDYPQDFMDSELEKDMISFISQQLNKK
jgi:predicted ATPase